MSAIEPAAAGLTLRGEPLPMFLAPPSAPLGPSPARRPGSVRRTATIDATWPDGRDGVTELAGAARDVATPPAGGGPRLLAHDRVAVRAEHRVILSAVSDPARPQLARLSGARAGGQLRAALDDILHDERAAGAPLYLLLDDMAGATLVAGWAWSRWTDDWMLRLPADEAAAARQRMEGICIGFRPGSGALGADGPRPDQHATRVVPLPRRDDIEGWHPLIDRGGVNFRRARRIDVWREGGLIHIDSMFQDSASAPDGGDRFAIHEYRLQATADAGATTLLSVHATPGTLPYAECPAAPANIGEMVGTPLRGLREAVLVKLRKTAGCTHLNDAMRALAEVPRLAGALPA